MLVGPIFDEGRFLDPDTDDEEGPPVFHVEDIQIPVSQPVGNIMIRVYTPEGPGPFPVHLNFHGGPQILALLFYFQFSF